MKKIIFLFLIISGCSNPNEKNEIIINNNFKEIITKYLDSNPIHPEKDLESEFAINIPQPSYQIVFDKRENDTIMSIKLLPHLTNYNPINFEKQGDSVTIYSQITPNGYFIFKKNPIVIYDLNNYSNDFINKQKLIKKIPDSLKIEINKIGVHIKSSTEYYKISNQEFETIDWEVINK